jgi:ribokinase
MLGNGCNVYSQTLGTFTVPTLAPAYLETSAARDAFCAALAAKLIDLNKQLDEDVLLWAAAAMSAAASDHPLANHMPDRQRVDQLLERSRFKLMPRGSSVGDSRPAEPPAAEQPSSFL